MGEKRTCIDCRGKRFYCMCIMEMQVKYCFVVRLVFNNHFSSTYWKRFADSLKNSTKDRAEKPTRNKMEIVKSDDAIKGNVPGTLFQFNIDVVNRSLWSKLCHQSDCVTHSHTVWPIRPYFHIQGLW